MSKTVKLRKGLDIKLVGSAEKRTEGVKAERYALKPTEFTGVFPKLLVKEGDRVKAGTALFFDKYREEVTFSSPVSGLVKEIKRGAKRVIQEIIVESDGKFEFEQFEVPAKSDFTAENIKSVLLKSGLWPVVRQRPYNVIANPNETPKSIFISAFHSAPLAADMDFIVDGNEDDFQLGLDALAVAGNCKIHLNVGGNTQSKVFANAKGVEKNTFNGPHPAANVGVQIHHIDPINKGDLVWHVHPVDVISIGRLLRNGTYDSSRKMALCGSEVKNPQYFEVYKGIEVKPLVENRLQQDNVRCISGDVLSGHKVEKYGFMGYYDHQLTIIPEGDQFEFLGWALPGFNKFSVSKTFFSWLNPKKAYRLDTNLHGGERAFVFPTVYEKVFPMDILPVNLLKAILVEDIDLMENLGIYEVAEEDFALCEVVCPSKIEHQDIVRKGLEMMRKEMS